MGVFNFFNMITCQYKQIFRTKRKYKKKNQQGTKQWNWMNERTIWV